MMESMAIVDYLIGRYDTQGRLAAPTSYPARAKYLQWLHFAEASLAPPVVAESGDPFTTIRVIHLLARIERGRPIRIADVVDRLNASHLDWILSAEVVAGVRSGVIS